MPCAQPSLCTPRKDFKKQKAAHCGAQPGSQPGLGGRKAAHKPSASAAHFPPALWQNKLLQSPRRLNPQRCRVSASLRRISQLVQQCI